MHWDKCFKTDAKQMFFILHKAEYLQRDQIPLGAHIPLNGMNDQV